MKRAIRIFSLFTSLGPLRSIVLFVITILALQARLPDICLAAEGAVTDFEIQAIEVTGNTVLPAYKVEDALAPFIGSGKTVPDVEKARDVLEKLYHDSGYPAVIVNIPEQTLEGGMVKLQVIESRIGRIKIAGNRYFAEEKIKEDLPSLAPGGMLYLPKVQEEIGRVNRNQDIKVDPVMTPGEQTGTIDIELKVEDRLPLHGYLELNNDASPGTKELRLGAMVRYDNLWQKEHSLSLQYIIAPQSPEEMQVLGASYALPTPWDKDHQLAFYGVWSNSNTTSASVSGLNVIGKGYIYGMRYVVPLPQYKLYSHNMTLGIDYKHFDQAEGLTTASGGPTTPISYVPLSLAYNATLPDEWGGVTQFGVGLNLSLRGLGSGQDELDQLRANARLNYFYATASIQRMQKLPWGMNLLVKVDGQVADQPLVSNEQYSAGGRMNVRGYLVSEELGDNALHATAELSFPNPFEKIIKDFQMTPFVFYDIARLIINDALPGQQSRFTLAGTGVGVRGLITKYVDYEVDWAVALDATNITSTYDQRIYFKIRAVL